MNPFFALAILIYGLLSASAANDSSPAPSNIANAQYPRIASDLSVSFQLKAPDAKQIKLEGGAGLVKEPIELTRGENGAWSVTTPPAVPGFHYYWFVVDGLRVNDPSSYSWFGWGRETSGIEIPEAGVDFYTAKQEVPHGEVRARWYFSKLTGKWATSFDGVFRDASAFNRKVKLLWLGAGTAETRVHANIVAVHQTLEQAGIKNVFYPSPGTDHEWQTWRRSLNDFAPRLFRD